MKRSAYNSICNLIGAKPEIHFVRVTRGGRIGFTAGRPDEIKWLLRRVRECNLRPTRSLLNTVRSMDQYNAYLTKEAL